MDPTATSPDPISEPQAYQQHLLGLLGSDDPAQVQAGAVPAWEELLAEAGALAATRPEPTEWSLVQCLAHAVDAEIVMSARYRWIVAHDEPPLIGYDQDLWVDRLHDGEEEPEALLTLLDALKDANIALWKGSSEAERARVGIHAERGPESFDLSYRMIAGHDRFHLAQARRALDAVRTG
jgi:hypothetical protein